MNNDNEEQKMALKPSKGKSTTFYTREEVSKHDKDGDIWLIINCMVYDVSKWIHKHPGGERVIQSLAGKDCSEVFRTFHHPKITKNLLPAFYIGKTTEVANGESVEQTAIAKDFMALRNTLEEEGAYKPDYWFYFRSGTLISILLMISLSLAVNSTSWMTTVAAGFFLGLFWQQMAFIGHDIGHHSVTHDTKADDVIACVIGNLLTGISVGWWRDSHNFHHIVTNSVNYDPDVQHLPVFAISKKFFTTFFSEYHKREFKIDAVAKLFVPYQHYLFYPVMAVARVNLYAQSLLFVLTSKHCQKKVPELASLLLFWVWFLAFCSVFPSWSHRLMFFFAAHATAGVIHVQICLSHFSMQLFDGLPQEAYEKDGYVITQFEATTNIKCSPALDFFHGGLQFQTEHHLFPRVSRSHLRRLKERVQPLCEKHGIPYREMGFIEANVSVLKTLKEAAKQSSCFSPFFADGINAVG